MREFEVMLRVKYEPSVETDGSTPAEPEDWNWLRICQRSVNAVVGAECVYAGEMTEV